MRIEKKLAKYTFFFERVLIFCYLFICKYTYLPIDIQEYKNIFNKSQF